MQNNVKDKFIRDLINELNNINENAVTYENKKALDVCYLVASVDQHIEKCQEFMDDITKYRYCINGYEPDNTEGYTNGKIRILIEKPEDEKECDMMFAAYYNYCYYIEFGLDERNWGYCQCLSSDKGYSEKYRCTGSGCDWTAPMFTLEKSISLGGGKWTGQERDYWEYERKFHSDEQNKNEEVEKQKKEQERQYIEDQIAELKNRLLNIK